MCALTASNSAQSARRHPVTENHPITATCSTTRQMLNQRKCDEGPAAPDAPHSVGDWGHRITHSLNDMLHNNTALAGECLELLACSDTPRDSSRNTFFFLLSLLSDIVLIVHSFIYDAIALHMVYVSFTAAKTAKGFVSFAAIVLMRSMAQLAMVRLSRTVRAVCRVVEPVFHTESGASILAG